MKPQGRLPGREGRASRVVFYNLSQISFSLLKPSSGGHRACDRSPDPVAPRDLARIIFLDLPPLTHSVPSTLASSLFLSSTCPFLPWLGLCTCHSLYLASLSSGCLLLPGSFSSFRSQL